VTNERLVSGKGGSGLDYQPARGSEHEPVANYGSEDEYTKMKRGRDTTARRHLTSLARTVAGTVIAKRIEYISAERDVVGAPSPLATSKPYIRLLFNRYRIYMCV
jgi:hypothetical protein